MSGFEQPASLSDGGRRCRHRPRLTGAPRSLLACRTRVDHAEQERRVARTVGGRPMVGMPERLVFEGPPIVFAPLWQDPELRRPIAVPGNVLDTRTALPDLNQLELSRLEKLKAVEASRVAPECAEQRERYIEAETAELTATRKLSEPAARAIVIKRCNHILLPDTVLSWDDDDLEGTTVADILRNPREYEGCTMADPLEGIAYGRCKARGSIQYDGAPLIHSFAHGNTTYPLLSHYQPTRAPIAPQTSP